MHTYVRIHGKVMYAHGRAYICMWEHIIMYILANCISMARCVCMCVLVSGSQMAILIRLNFHRVRINGRLAAQDVVCTHNSCRKSIVHGWQRGTCDWNRIVSSVSHMTVTCTH